MKLNIDPGKYVVAVSGGVDSVVLLDALSKQEGVELIVAHFNHGIRPDSANDEEFVKKLAEKYHLPFEKGQGNLGSNASEEKARKARYDFLNETLSKYQAKAIITAHHQDDLVETATINLLRGTGRKGLNSLKSRPGLLRPLLGISKEELIKYAKNHGLSWREDPTNIDQKYYRNYIRHSVLPKMSAGNKQKLLKIIQGASSRDIEIDRMIDRLLDTSVDGDAVSRTWFAGLPHSVSKELLAHWLRKHKLPFDAGTLERLSVQIKTIPKGKRVDAGQGWSFTANNHTIRLQRPK